MKLKPPSDRKEAIRRGECVADGCTRPLHGFGYCREHLDELNTTMARGVGLPSTVSTLPAPPGEEDCTCNADPPTVGDDGHTFYGSLHSFSCPVSRRVVDKP